MTNKEGRLPVKLFRREAVEYAKVRDYGVVVLHLGPWRRLIAPAILAAVTASLVLLATTPYTRTVSANGVVMPSSGLVRLVSPIDGQVAEVFSAEGAWVKRNEPLFLIEQRQLSSSGADVGKLRIDALSAQEGALETERASIRSRRDERRAEGEARERRLRNQIDNLSSQILIQEKIVLRTRDSFERYQSLTSDRFVSLIELNQAETSALQAEQRLVDLRQEMELAHLALSQFSSDTADVAATDAEAVERVARQLGVVATEKALEQTRTSRRVDAPMNGLMSSVLVEPSHNVVVGQTLATLYRNGSEHVVEAYVTSGVVAHIHAGTKVALQVDAFPYAKYGVLKGVVNSIASSPTTTDELAKSGRFPFQADEPLYKVRIHVVPADNGRFELKKLSPGMQLKAQFGLERRRFYEYILKPIQNEISKGGI